MLPAILLGMAALLSSVTDAQQGSQCLYPEQLSHVLFLQSDADGDGVLHLQEMMDAYTMYDTNGDGLVSYNEFMEHHTQGDPAHHHLPHQLYQAWDMNGDHHLEVDDFQQFYAHVDADDDDQVSELEFNLYYIELLQNIRHGTERIC